MPVFDLNLVRERFVSLTPRQCEVALLLVDGFTNAQIAHRLGVTVHTVKAHRMAVMHRMQALSFAELVRQIQLLGKSDLLHEKFVKTPLHVIVVEDDLWYRDYLTENLSERGFSTVGVADNEGFMAAWAQRHADIVILDIELGADERDGLDIAAWLRSNASCGVVMVTARGGDTDRIHGLAVGADAYFPKPVNIDELAVALINLGRRLRSAGR
jgi:DNA-binding NarL/FixJ family response regulator